ncbi:MAG: hypothetical protein WC197_02600 [Candidatus Gastranaerophilaceae bacterium]|jgi:predicted MPP superfamily phosphohydrolase
MKILLIGDVHAGAPFIDEKKLDKIVKLSNKEKSDLALFVGYFVIEGVVGGKFIDPSIIAKSLSQIKTTRGLITVLG